MVQGRRAGAVRPVLGNEMVQVPGGSRKKLQSKPGRKQQVSGSRPREVRQHTVRSEGSDGRHLESISMQAFRSEECDGRHLLGAESSSRGAILRQQAGRAQSKSRRERQVMRNLLSETSLHGCWTLFYPPSSLPMLHLWVTFLGIWVSIMRVPPEMAVSLEISPHKRPFPGHYQQLIPHS